MLTLYSSVMFLYLDLPSVYNLCLFTNKNLPKGINFTYLEDPGIYIYISGQIIATSHDLTPKGS